MLVVPQEYSLEFQARLVSALAVIHNFIRIHDPGDIEEDSEDEGEDTSYTNTQINERNLPADERGRAGERRERIAHAMWKDYKK